MAVELMTSYSRGGNESFATTAAANTEETTLREAAAAGIHGVREFLKLINNGQSKHKEIKQPEITEVIDVAVNCFRKVISLLGRSTTGHARFKRGPAGKCQEPQQEQSIEQAGPSVSFRGYLTELKTEQKTEIAQKSSAFGAYCPTPVRRLPPLPHHQNRIEGSANKERPDLFPSLLTNLIVTFFKE